MRALLGLILGATIATGDAVAADWINPPPAPAVVANPFEGAYAAVGGSYGASNSRLFTENTSLSSLTDTTYAAGWSGVGAVGINVTFGSFLLGAELDGRWGNEKATSAGSSNSSGPTGGVLSYSYANDASVHASVRAGAVVRNTLIFAKAGLGAAHIKDAFAVDDTRAALQLCSGFPAFVCTTQFGSTGSFESRKWVPSAVFGVGIEQNFAGAFFVRASAEAEWLSGHTVTFSQRLASPSGLFSGQAGQASFGSGVDAQWTARAMLMGGLRF